MKPTIDHVEKKADASASTAEIALTGEKAGVISPVTQAHGADAA